MPELLQPQRRDLIGIETGLDDSYYSNPGRLLDVFNREFNTLDAFREIISRSRKSYTFDPKFDAISMAMNDPSDVFDIGVLSQARNQEEYVDIRDRLRREREDMDVMANVDFDTSMALGGALSLADPINLLLLPFAIPRGLSLAAVLGRNLVAGLVVVASQEAVLLSARQSRTIEESAVNIASGTILSGALGTLGHTVGRSRTRSATRRQATHDEMAAAVDDDMTIGGQSAAREDFPDAPVTRNFPSTPGDGASPKPGVKPSKAYTIFGDLETVRQAKADLIEKILDFDTSHLDEAVAVRMGRIIALMPDALFETMTIAVRNVSTVSDLGRGRFRVMNNFISVFTEGGQAGRFLGEASRGGARAGDASDVLSHEFGHSALSNFMNAEEFDIAVNIYNTVKGSRSGATTSAGDFHEWVSEIFSEAIGRNIDGRSRRTDFRAQMFPEDEGVLYKIVRLIAERIATFAKRLSKEPEVNVSYEELVDNFIGNMLDSIEKTGRRSDPSLEAKLRIGRLGEAVVNDPDFRTKYNQAFDDLAGRTPPGGGGDGVLPPGAGAADGDAASPGRGAGIQPTGTGLEDKIGQTIPGLRLIQNPSHWARITAEDMIELPYLLKQNFYKIKTAQPVEALIKLWRAPLVEVLADVRADFIEYHRRFTNDTVSSDRKIIAKQAISVIGRKIRGATDDPSKPMDLLQFRKEAGKAARRMDASDIPEIARAAVKLRKVIDQMSGRAQAVNLLEGNLSAFPSRSFFPRMHLQDKIRKEMDAYVDRIMSWQEENFSILPPELQRQIQQGNHRLVITGQADTVSGLQGGLEGSQRHTAAAGKKGVFQERTIFVPDEIIEEWLESDVDVVMKQWVHQVAADVEIATRFKTLDMKERFELIAADYKKLIDEAPDAEARKKLTKQWQQTEADVIAMRDLNRGTYNMPDDPYAPTSVGARLIMEWNNLTMLGMVAVSSLPDAFRTTMVNGMASWDVVQLAFKDFKSFKIAAGEAKLAGGAMDMELQTNARALAHTGELANRYTGPEVAVGYLSNAWFILNGLSPWNASIKKMAGAATGHRMASDLKRLSKGTLGAKKEARLLSMGIDGDDAIGILKMLEEHGELVHGVNLPNTSKWVGSPEALKAQQTWRAALVQEIDAQIITPGHGDLPLLAHITPGTETVKRAVTDALGDESKIARNVNALYPELGRLFFQYKSFQFASITRTAISGLQQRDAAALAGLTGMVITGGVVAMLKDIANGRPTVDSVDEFLFDGFDQSGAWGWAGSINTALEALSDNGIGMRPLLGMADPWGSSLQWKVGAIAGPTAGQAVRAGGIGIDAITGNVDWHTGYNAMKYVPGQNWFPLKMYNVARSRRWFEEIEENDRSRGIR